MHLGTNFFRNHVNEIRKLSTKIRKRQFVFCTFCTLCTFMHLLIYNTNHIKDAMSTLGARKLFFVRKRIMYIIIFLISFVNYNIYIIYACIRRNEGAKGAKGAMLKSTVHTFAFLCKMTMPRNFFSVFFNAPLTD